MSERKKVLIKGSAKKVEFSNGGHVYNFDMKISQVVKILDYLNEQRKKDGHQPTDYLRFSLSERRNGKDEYGNTHIVFCDLWTPPAAADGKESVGKSDESDDMPF